LKGKITLNEHRLYVALRQIYYLIFEAEEDIASKYGLSGQQFIVLLAMEIMSKVQNRQIKITDLASSLYRSVYSISTITDRMEKNGLVTKKRNLSDRRVINISITPLGHKKFIRVIKACREMLKRIFLDLSDSDFLSTISFLKTVEKNILSEPALKKIKINSSIRNGKEIVDFINQDI